MTATTIHKALLLRLQRKIIFGFGMAKLAGIYACSRRNGDW
jgi:hypothetical protein